VNVGESLREELGGGYLEDPCATLADMGDVRKRLLANGNDTPLASNVVVTQFPDVIEARDWKRILPRW